jgi:hypothetical protein
MPNPLVNNLLRNANKKYFLWNKFTIAGLKVWLDADDKNTLYQDNVLTTPVAADGDVVGGWRDKATEANKAVQATSAKKPLYKTAIQNGKAGVLFDGANDYVQWSITPLLNNAVTVIAVMTPIDLNSTGCWAFFDGTGTTNPYFMYAQTDTLGNTFTGHLWDGVDRNVNIVGDPTGANIFGFDNVSGSVVNIYRNGIKTAGVVNTGAYAGFSGGIWYLGIWGDVVTSPYSGYIHELLVYNRVLTVAELKILWEYLGNKWKISTVVPAKSRPWVLPNCTLWIDVSQMNALNNTPIHVLPDLSGNESHGVQATRIKEGLFKTNILNGLPGILMDAIDDYFYLDKVLPVASECSVFGVFTVVDHAPTSRPMLWGFTDPGAAPYVNQCFYGPPSAVNAPDINVTTMVGWDGSAKESLLNVVPIGSHVFGSTEKESDFIKVYFDNNIGTGTAMGASFTSPYSGKGVIGSNMDGLSRWMNGYIHELIVWNRVLTTDEIAIVNSYLTAKWGITL